MVKSGMTEQEEFKAMSTSAAIFEDINSFKSLAEQSLNAKIERYNQNGSGWSVNKILEYFFTVTKYTQMPFLSGHRFITTPEIIYKSKAVINVQNNDNLCFLYAILSILHYDDISNNRHRVENYSQYLNELKYDENDMPMRVKNIKKFETANNLNINILIYYAEPDIYIDFKSHSIKNPYFDILYRGSDNPNAREVNLLMIGTDTNYHYVGIINLDRLLNVRDRFNGFRIQSKWCPKCLHGFRFQSTYDKHVDACKLNKTHDTLYLMPSSDKCCFKDYNKMIRPPFIIYADFESCLAPHDKFFQIHTPLSAGLLLITPNNNYQYFVFEGDDCIINFLAKIELIAKDIVIPWYDSHNMRVQMTALDRQIHDNSTHCYLCNKHCPGLLVIDHDHFTGAYLGAACNDCNLSRQIKRSLPVVFHNLRGYDMHHILKYAIGKFNGWSISCVPQTMEKFQALMVSFNQFISKSKFRIKFIDSYQFLKSSLSNLCNLLTDFPLTHLEFSSSVNKKSIFPYHLITRHSDLTTITQLPPKWNSQISDEDYQKAIDTWNNIRCNDLGDYMRYYLKLDCFLLADIFEQFRQKAIDEDGLDPANYFSLPGLSWASALRTVKVDLKLITDPEMYNFFENGIRGGMTFVNKHHVAADENTELLYIDINNLYGWALSQPLPYGNFQWIYSINTLWELIENIKNDALDDEHFGYTFEVDLETPVYYRNFLDQLPLAPEKRCPPDSNVTKLLLTHNNKCNYVVHYRLLSVYLKLGMRVIKVHRAIKYSQDYVFRDYVDMNSRKRAAATSALEKDYYKLKPNSLYGKTVENLKKRICVRLCNNPRKLETYTSNIRFKRSIAIDTDFVSCQLVKESVVLNRPSYIGQSVLDISKVRMYELQYFELQKYRTQYNCEIDIIAGDTDSFFLSVKNLKLDVLIAEMIKNKEIDTSNYHPNNPLYNTSLKSVIGKFKDESGGNRFKEWIFIKPKCYSLLYDNENFIMKSKGVNLKQTKLKHKAYKAHYEFGHIITVPQERIGSIDHQLYTIRTHKLALGGHDNKRKWLDKNKSVAYGHPLDTGHEFLSTLY